MGNLLAPLLFILLNVNLRQSLIAFLRSGIQKSAPENSREIILDEMTVGTTTMTTPADAGYNNDAMKY